MTASVGLVGCGSWGLNILGPSTSWAPRSSLSTRRRRLETRRAGRARRTRGPTPGLWGLCQGGDEPWLVIEASNRFATRRREVRVHGDRAVAALDDATPGVVRIEHGSGLVPTVDERAVDEARPLHRELAAFLDHVAGGPPPKSTADEGLAIVEAIEALRRLAGLESGPNEAEQLAE